VGNVRAIIAAIAELCLFFCCVFGPARARSVRDPRYHCGHCRAIFVFVVCYGLRVHAQCPRYHCGHCRIMFVFVVCLGLRMQGLSAISLRPLPSYVFFFCVLCVMACACTLSAISLQPLVLAQFGSPTIMYMPPTASKTASSGSYRNGAMDTAELCRFKVFFGMSHSLSTHPLATPSKLFGVQITTPRPRLSTRIETQAVHHKCWRCTGVARQEYVRRVPETARPRYLLHSSSFRRQSVHCSEIPSKERRGRAGFILQLWPRVELWWTPSWHEDVRRHV
jgi:hypothetical protein